MPAPPFDEQVQGDWSGGMCRAVARHLIPRDAAYDIREGLLDDDGNVYQRGATARVTTSQLGTALAAVWEGSFSVGRRTIGVSNASVGVVDAAGTGWFVLTAAAGTAALAGGGLTAKVGEMLLFPITSGGSGAILAYAGSRKAPSSSALTASAVNGSTAVTGTGTSWLTTAEPGMFITIVGGPSRIGVIKSVTSDTQIVLEAPWTGPTMASTHSLAPYVAYGATLGLPVAVASVGGRALLAIGRKVVMSRTIDPATGAARPFDFDVTDYHEFPADVVALATLRDRVFVFTKAGVYAISNVMLDIVDAFGNAQHRVEKVSGDVILRSPGGVAPWRDSLVVCAVDGVYMLDASGGLELLSRSIAPLWQAHMKAGYTVGQVTTFRDHVFVPVGGEVLVGRLDRRAKTPVGQSAPWTRFVAGEAAITQAFAVQDPYGSPKLVGGTSGSGYLVDLTGVFGTGALPAAAGGLVDGNAAAVGMLVETREYMLDGGALGTVRDVTVEYESTDGVIVASAAVAQRATPAAAPTYAALASTAPANYATQAPRVIAVRREARRVSFTFSGSGVTGWRLRAVRTRSRLRGRRR